MQMSMCCSCGAGLHHFRNFRQPTEAKVKMIAAACEGFGIGQKGDLPWRLQEEWGYFRRMTKMAAPGMKNAVVMARKTYESIPEPLDGRINLVITSQKDYVVSEKVLVCNNFDLQEIVRKLKGYHVDTIWLCGGIALYKHAMDKLCATHIYLTRIHAKFNCVTFFPEIDLTNYVEVHDPNVDAERHYEGDITWNYKVYEGKDVRLLS